MIADFRRSLRGVIADLMGVAGDQKVMWTPSLPIVYIGNPKCGSSTIKHSLKQTQAAEYIRAGIAFERSEGLHEGDGCLNPEDCVRPLVAIGLSFHACATPSPERCRPS